MARVARVHGLGRRQRYGPSPVTEPPICRTAARPLALAVATPRAQDWRCIGPLGPRRGCCRRFGRCCRGPATWSRPSHCCRLARGRGRRAFATWRVGQTGVRRRLWL
jgi:hypothetical protein